MFQPMAVCGPGCGRNSMSSARDPGTDPGVAMPVGVLHLALAGEPAGPDVE